MLTVKTGSIDPVVPAQEQYNEFPPGSPPEVMPITPEERSRRRQLVTQILARREELRRKYGPLDVSTSALKHMAREEERT